MLSNFQLEKLAKTWNLPLNGVYSKDELEHIDPRNGNYIINLQSATDGQGTHWECLVIRGAEAFTFDSFGALPPTEIIDFSREAREVRHLGYNRTVIQHLHSDSCGWYVLGLLLFIKGHPSDALHIAANRYINLFGADLKANENILSDMYKGLPKNSIVDKFLKRKTIHG